MLLCSVICIVYHIYTVVVYCTYTWLYVLLQEAQQSLTVYDQQYQEYEQQDQALRRDDNTLRQEKVYTVDHEIFVVKIFSSTTFSDEN